MTPWEEMYRVFNMGHRMELYVDKEDAQSIIDIACCIQSGCQDCGAVRGCLIGKLTIKSGFGEFQY